MKRQDAYAAAGVSIDAGNESVRRIKRHVRSTRTAGVLADVGLFGGLFRLPRGLRRPVLVASTDGVGTKLLVAAKIRKYDTIGQDLVNHCVNDILVQGADPLFFLDYFATGRLDPRVVEQVVKGLALACRENGCALLGGETAEMPGLYGQGDFDLAGTIVGAVEQSAVIDGSGIRPGDVLLGLPSTGLQTNGYSLARKILFTTLKLKPESRLPGMAVTAAEELLAVHRSYWRPVRELRKRFQIKGMAHITGGGFLENIPRILPAGCVAEIRKGSWPVLPVFSLLQSAGKVPEETMYRTFNMGIGLVLVAGEAEAGRMVRFLRKQGESVHGLGTVQSGKKSVRLTE